MTKPEAVDGERLATLAASDPLATHSAALQAPGSPGYVLGGALAAHHRLGRIDGWCITGPADDAAELYDCMLRAAVFTGASVPRAALADLQARHSFGEPHLWDFRWTDTAPDVDPDAADWLPGDPGTRAEVQRLLDEAFPAAAVQTADSGARRWAGVRGADGALVAVAADATAAPGIGFLSSITTAAAARGGGIGTALTAWATARLVAEHGRASLWVDHPNRTARRVYDRLGYRDEHRMVWLELPPSG